MINVYSRDTPFEEIMGDIHAFVPVHEGCVNFAATCAKEVESPRIGEVIWEQNGYKDTPLKAKIGRLRSEGYINIHVIGNKEMEAK